MQRIPSLIVIFTFLTLVFGCTVSEKSLSSGDNSKQGNTIKVTNDNIPLDNYLRRLPGVNVQGSGSNAKIIIQGVNTFLGSTDPLFYIDSTRVGRSYSWVVGMVNMHDVESITVVKGPEASAYGVEGGNGVIIINTKGSGG